MFFLINDVRLFYLFTRPHGGPLLWGNMKLKSIPILALAAFLATGCATMGDKGAQNSNPASPTPQQVQQASPSSDEIKAKVAEELKELGEKELAENETPESEGEITYDIPITINRQVEFFLDYFQNRIPKRFATWLARSGRYVPMMRHVLKEHGLPEDLVYLAMIESGFSCQAYSRAHAVGPWQFIRGTGRRYGLEISYWVDERRDPVKATHAAAQYLKDLYGEFGSWYLAAAAYNAGEAKVRRALKRYQAEDFWSISQRKRRYLKRETKQYVPKMIAAAMIAKDPAKYGFKDIPYEEPWHFDVVKVHPGTSLSLAAKLAGIKTQELAALNPELRRWCTPPRGGSYELRIPVGRKASFETQYAQLSPRQRQARIGTIKVRLQKGDTLGRIAHTHGVKLHDLVALNPRLNPRRLAIGQVVVVPPPGGHALVRAKRTAPMPASAMGPMARRHNLRKIVHTVRRGDTLWDIAQAYGINYRDIGRWNGRHSPRLSIGQKLVLYVPQAKAEAKVEPPVPVAKTAADAGKTLVYRVRRGDTLWEIGRRFKVSPADIRRWNKLRGSRITPGDTLTVRLGSNI